MATIEQRIRDKQRKLADKHLDEYLSTIEEAISLEKDGKNITLASVEKLLNTTGFLPGDFDADMAQRRMIDRAQDAVGRCHERYEAFRPELEEAKEILRKAYGKKHESEEKKAANKKMHAAHLELNLNRARERVERAWGRFNAVIEARFRGRRLRHATSQDLEA